MRRKDIFRGAVIVLAILAFQVSVNADFGDPDTSFGFGGEATDPSADFTPTAMAIQPDGKILVAGARNNGTEFTFAMKRYLSNGDVDLNFGYFGWAVTYSSLGAPRDIEVQSNGKITVTGTYRATTDRGIVWQFLANGQYDSTFHSTGRVIFYNATECTDAVTYHPPRDLFHRIYVVCDDGWLYSLKSNGYLDSSFGDSGRVDLPFEPYSVELQNSSVFVAGHRQTQTIKLPAIGKYNLSGVPNTHFGVNGIFSEDPYENYPCSTNNPSNDRVRSRLAFQNDGRVLLYGRAWSLNLESPAWNLLVRHELNGSFDTRFKMSPCVESSVEIGGVKRIFVLPDDRLLFVHSSWFGELRSPNGDLIESVGNLSFSAIALQPDAKFVTAEQANPGMVLRRRWVD